MSVSILTRLKGNEDLLRHIYAYDDTYRTIFRQQVLCKLWARRWETYRASFVCPLDKAVVGYLAAQCAGPTLLPYRKRATLPDDYRIISYDDDNFVRQIHIYVWSERGRLCSHFRGTVLTPWQYEHLDDINEETWTMEVYGDPESGCVVCTNLHR